jgi:hypothetical protein
MMFSTLNLKNYASVVKILQSQSGILELLPSGGIFIRELPKLALHGINGDSAGNYCTTSWTRNPPYDWLFCREFPAHTQGINWKNGYSARNYHLRVKESTGGRKFCRKSPAHR